MKKNKAAPKCLVVSGQGINCEEETMSAFLAAGTGADLVHVNQLLDAPHLVDDYQILAFPGGFSYADHTGAGNAFALKLQKVVDNIKNFVLKDKLVIGICNGAQILTRLFCDFGVVFESNDSCQYQCQWVDLDVVNHDSPWLLGIKSLRLPIAHAEGKLIADDSKTLKTPGLAAMRYQKNPNGSEQDLAAITAFDGRMLITMPHPERAIFLHQTDVYHTIKEKAKRSDSVIQKDGPGICIFKNAFRYFTD